MATIKTAIKVLKEGKFCMMEGEPCKVTSLITSKPGKHGGAKARLEGTGLFDSKKRTIIKPADTEIEVPIVEKKVAQVVAITGSSAQFMDTTDYEMFEAPIPDDLKDKVTQGCEVQYWNIEGRRMIIGLR